MRNTVRKAWIVLPFVTAAMVVVGCSTASTGNPIPQTGPSASGGQQSSSAPTSSAGDSRLGSVNACDLLTTQEAASLMKAQGPGHNEDTTASGATSNCKWTGRSADDSSTNLSISVRAAQGLDQVNNSGGNLTQGSINGRPASQYVPSAGGYCMVSLAVSSDSRVDLGYSLLAATDNTEVCRTASDIANIVEPKLPKYEG
ncbi:DUF3558 domain-containing protein [Amycolatopsis acidiphila]|uniref:DUF3558 domain-containing protein n=1 Tax=Amycolatopsis acidiphila TaxID=715473 RepID=A0A558AMV0_9PSEU|nr:DUF3558 family protein [Amycolatopsis acidiphila]TVT25550.1 DUF3558 domain-containing protein [Amycolatopsis acidiphila]UIJ60298.1 DUF3558 domain-containing protein [Amycolatopsis acidiphila]GHG60226.1 hypothetical protein GCM10017788_13780 [Amycolatopsis acidiphila]